MSNTYRFAWLAAAALVVAGCFGSGTTRSPQLFVLSVVGDSAAPEAPDSGLRLGVGPVSLPERLNRPQIVTRVGAHEVTLSEFSRWAEPLDDGFTGVLSENLSRLVPTDRVVVYPWSARTQIDLKVEVEVIHFTGLPNGSVTLAARWRLTRGDGSEILPLQLSSYNESIGVGRTEALVAAMSRALGNLSRDIAAAISSAER
jgi:uncharacterized lipoprotein YmbA